jgi:hypothetical protein|tara:strand:+ start:534 stop:755 length:222 start_codon:yes stop_codon:yes gene_type:complete
VQKGTRVYVTQMDNWEIKDFKVDLDRNFDIDLCLKNLKNNQDNGWEVLIITSNRELPSQRLMAIMRKKENKSY